MVPKAFWIVEAGLMRFKLLKQKNSRTMLFDVATLNLKDRTKLAEIIQVVLDAKEFIQWFGVWLQKLTLPAS
jgi:5,10-methylene-tetrahydrofolate dehydrogenase/methenyl tetrahydrofolate cyclohydrolase